MIFSSRIFLEQRNRERIFLDDAHTGLLREDYLRGLRPGNPTRPEPRGVHSNQSDSTRTIRLILDIPMIESFPDTQDLRPALCVARTLLCAKNLLGAPPHRVLCEGWEPRHSTFRNNQLATSNGRIWSALRDSNLRRFAGVSEAGARSRNPERSPRRISLI